MENVNWDGVWQSITDMWLPTFGWIAVIAAIITVVLFVQKRKK